MYDELKERESSGMLDQGSQQSRSGLPKAEVRNHRPTENVFATEDVLLIHVV
jgi:hypothetical protein